MTINTRLKFAMLVPAIMALVISLALYLSYQVVADAQEKDRIAQDIIGRISDLNNVFYTYMLYHQEQAAQTLMQQHSSLMTLTTLRLQNTEQQQLLNELRQHIGALGMSFSTLITSYERPGSTQHFAPATEAEERLVAQLLIDSRHVLSDALVFERLIDEEITATQGRIGILIFLLILAATVPLTLVLTRMMTGITASLAALRRGTELIGAGNLDHRIGMSASDELGELARSFDHMTEQLQTVTVSKNKLQQEVEARKEAEKSLRESQETTSAILASVPVLMLVVDGNRRVLKANDAALKFAGTNIDEMAGLPVGEALGCLHSREDPGGCGFAPACQTCKVNLCVLETLETEKRHLQVEWDLPFSVGGKREELTFLSSTVPLATAGRQALICLEDITERRRMKERLAVQERLAYLGKMSGTVAHEVRNPLAAVDAAAYYLEKHVDDAESKTKEYLRRIRNGVARASRIIAKLLDMSHMKEPVLADINLIEFVNSTVSSAGVPGTIRVVLDWPQEEIRVMADEEQLRMAVENLLRNAVEAMAQRGTLTIGVCKADGWVSISVADTGPGIPPTNLSRLFQPLFTTKPGGVGFGLALTRSIVEQHGGKIEVKSVPGEGATFVMLLPLPVQAGLEVA